MQVVVDGLLTQYVRQGSAKRTLLVVHGWADRAASFQTVIAGLAGQYQVIALDLPGFGGTDLPPATWGLDDYARFVEHFLRKIDAPHLTAIIGHSNGGALAIRGLANGTLQADKLVLLASAGVRGTAKGRNAALKVIAKVGKVVTAPLPQATRQKLRRRLYGAAGSDMLVVEALQETFKKVVGDDVRPDAARLTLPTLLLYGQQDEATPPAFGEALQAAIRGSKLEIMPDAGHFIHLDQPQQVLTAIQGFLR